MIQRLAVLVVASMICNTSRAAPVAAGGMDGGGGQGLLCQGGDGKRSLRSLDLYEAENIWGYRIPKGASHLDEYLRIDPNQQRYLDTWPVRVGPPPARDRKEIESDFQNFYHGKFENRLMPIPQGARLKLSGDAGSPVIQYPPSCQLVQVLFYVDEDIHDGRILVDREYWNLLAPQDQLAFAFHEDLYKWQRGFGARNSIAIRKIVGLLFRDQPYPSITGPTYGQKHLRYCHAVFAPDYEGGGISFFIVPEKISGSQENALLVFDRLVDKLLSVETVLPTGWDYGKWMRSEAENTMITTGWTKSVLGSKEVVIGYQDVGCMKKKRKCGYEIKVRGDDGKWSGGKLSCRDLR